MVLCSDLSFVFLGHDRKGLQFSIVKLLGSSLVLLLPGWDYKHAFEAVTKTTAPQSNLHSETIRPQGDKLKLQETNPCDRDKRLHLSERNCLYYLDGASTYTIGVTKLLRMAQKMVVDITLHNNIHLSLNSCDVQVDERTSKEFGYFTAWLAQRHDLFPFRSNWMIFDDESFVCGTVDALFTNEERTEFVLVDWKRQNRISMEKKNEWGLQLSMYA